MLEYASGGGSACSGGGLPGPGGWGCLPGRGGGVCLVPGGVGSAWSRGVCLVWGGLPGPGGCLPGPGGGLPQCMLGYHPPGTRQTPPVNRMTNRCKNITLATTSLRPVKSN